MLRGDGGPGREMGLSSSLLLLNMRGVRRTGQPAGCGSLRAVCSIRNVASAATCCARGEKSPRKQWGVNEAVDHRSARDVPMVTPGSADKDRIVKIAPRTFPRSTDTRGPRKTKPTHLPDSTESRASAANNK